MFNYHYGWNKINSKMKIFALIISFTFLVSGSDEKIRELEYNGTLIQTTYDIEHKFIGKYIGAKNGYLELDKDGNGIYRYDYAGLSRDCPGDQIELKWGFILDDSGEVLKLKKPYGFSYPIIYNCSGENAFQGCTKRSMIDFILVYEDGTITVSSSDDWVKAN